MAAERNPGDHGMGMFHGPHLNPPPAPIAGRNTAGVDASNPPTANHPPLPLKPIGYRNTGGVRMDPARVRLTMPKAPSPVPATQPPPTRKLGQ